ncbi:MAG: hypoxanthine phosphoribosyltransferase [Verrucomicrobiae bacterium]|nr:hypoxanthine phosphoribosyltransferase [Verrucomicrobiae bacterium]
MFKVLEEILVTEQQIRMRTHELGREISNLYGEEEISVISIVNGAIIFTADLLRTITSPIRLDCIRVSSYGNSTTPETAPEILDNMRLDIAGRHVLIVDDILDTGKTISKVVDVISKQNPASIRSCMLLEKQGTRKVDYKADFIGFEIPDKFVVGYGLDFAGRYRNIPVIGVLKEELQTVAV